MMVGLPRPSLLLWVVQLSHTHPSFSSLFASISSLLTYRYHHSETESPQNENLQPLGLDPTLETRHNFAHVHQIGFQNCGIQMSFPGQIPQHFYLLLYFLIAFRNHVGISFCRTFANFLLSLSSYQAFISPFASEFSAYPQDFSKPQPVKLGQSF